MEAICGCYWQKTTTDMQKEGIRNCPWTLSCITIPVIHLNWYHLQGSKISFLCELTDGLSWPGQPGCSWPPQIITENTNWGKYCTYSEAENRTCPYMVAWGVTTPVHTGDDGSGGPVSGWVGELWLLRWNGKSWFDSRKLGGIVWTRTQQIWTCGILPEEGISLFCWVFSGSVFAEDEDRDVKQRYSVKKPHVGWMLMRWWWWGGHLWGRETLLCRVRVKTGCTPERLQRPR